MNEISNTTKKLYLLISIFLISLFVLFYVNSIFEQKIKKLDLQTKNQIAKLKIGEYLIENINNYKTSFYELGIVTNSSKSRKIVLDKINTIVSNINHALDVIQNSGTIKQKIKLNIQDHMILYKNIKYQNNDINDISLEIISIKPRIKQLKQMLSNLEILLNKRLMFKKSKNYKQHLEISNKIKRFYKSAPTLFNRMSEDIRRILYESDLVLIEVKKEIKIKKENYNNLKITINFSIILVVVLLGYWISRIINKEYISLNKEKLTLNSILNAQDNIIVVTNGFKMVNVNNAVLKFFKIYKSSDEFIELHDCICDYFKDNIEDDSYIKGTIHKGTHWIDYIIMHDDKEYKVIMNDTIKDHHFLLSAQKTKVNLNEEIYVVTLHNITTQIENAQKLFELNNTLEAKVKDKTLELLKVNESLEEKIEIEINKNTIQQKQIFETSKMAQMGEMIGNIAHQWRQPLSVISTISSGMQVQNEYNTLTNELIDKSCNSINNNIEFLSTTIDTFTNFIKDEKEERNIIIQDDINRTINILKANLDNHFISLKSNINETKDINIIMIAGELSQVIINIINNAKDVLVEKNITNPWIELNLQEVKNKVIITIEDNAGGIPEDIINKIFDPYFTTKHKSQGTGLGLHMSYKIINESLNGNIFVKNTKNGAQFNIELMLN